MGGKQRCVCVCWVGGGVGGLEGRGALDEGGREGKDW